ncbi:hypothetical protein AN220_17560 [Streptomyces nanshensis]|nr:hypothetical protein AN220_17560 [Streptomyces nanshensis]
MVAFGPPKPGDLGVGLPAELTCRRELLLGGPVPLRTGLRGNEELAEYGLPDVLGRLGGRSQGGREAGPRTG